MTTVSETPEGITARPAAPTDLPAIERIERASFPQPWPAEAFEHYVGRPGFLLAHDPDATIDVVGFVVADTTMDGGQVVGHVKDLAVAPKHRERGIGSFLLRRGLSVLAATDVEEVRLEVRADNDAARRLYRRFGFEPDGRKPSYYRDGTDAVVMVRASGRPAIRDR